MRIEQESGGGTHVYLTGNEVARAIDAWLVARSVVVIGPRTIRLEEPGPGAATGGATIYVDPSGRVLYGGDEP